MSNTSPDSQTAAWSDFARQVKENRTWFIILGISMIILGCISIFYPFISSVAAKIALGWIILFAGIMQVVYAFQTKTWSGFFIDLIVGIIYIIAGAYLSFTPTEGLKTLTAVVGILFLVECGMRTYMAFQMKPVTGWGWVLFSAIMAGIAGLLILNGLPDTSNWVLGLLVGINFISSGWSLIFLANNTAVAEVTVTTTSD